MGADQAFGASLRRLRQERSITVTELADRVGVSRPTIWSWEAGRSVPRNGRLKALTNTLNVLEDELILILGNSQEQRGEESLGKLVASSRQRIAELAGTTPDKVDVTIRW